jgi:hypothetical protein
MKEVISRSPEMLPCTGIGRVKSQAYTLLCATFPMKSITEQLLSQQQAILELSMPVLKLWDEIALLPLIGVIDTDWRIERDDAAVLVYIRR